MVSENNTLDLTSEVRKEADSWGALELNRTDSELIKDFCERLDSVFAKYGCDPDEDGWRELALHLLLKCEPAFSLKPVDSKKIRNLSEMILMARLLSADNKLTASDAAKRVAKETGKNARTLEARYSEAKNSNAKELNKGYLLMTLVKAAEALQNSDRRSTNYIKLLAESARLKPRTELFP